MHISYSDNLIHIHIIVTADTAELVCKSNVHSTVGILYHFGHFCGTDVGNDYLTLAEGSVIFLHLLTNLFAVSTNGAVVMEQLIHHIAGDDTLRSVNEVDVLTNLEAVRLNYRTNELVHSTRAYS